MLDTHLFRPRALIAIAAGAALFVAGIAGRSEPQGPGKQPSVPGKPPTVSPGNPPETNSAVPVPLGSRPFAVTFSPRGDLLAAALENGEIRLFKLKGDAVEQTPATLKHSVAVLSMDFSPDGTQLVAALYDGQVLLYTLNPADLKTSAKTVLRPSSIPATNYASAVAFKPDGKRIVAAFQNSKLLAWDRADANQTFQPNLNYFKDSIPFSKSALSVDFGRKATEGEWFVASSADPKIVLRYSKGAKAIETTLDGHSTKVTSVVFSPDRTQLVTLSSDVVLLWEYAAGIGDVKPSTLVASKGVDGNVQPKKARSVAFGRDGMVAIGFLDGTVTLYQATDFTKPKELRNMTVGSGTEPRVSAVALSPNNKLLAAVSYDNMLRVWNTPELLKPPVAQKKTETEEEIKKRLEAEKAAEIAAIKKQLEEENAKKLIAAKLEIENKLKEEEKKRKEAEAAAIAEAEKKKKEMAAAEQKRLEEEKKRAAREAASVPDKAVLDLQDTPVGMEFSSDKTSDKQRLLAILYPKGILETYLITKPLPGKPLDPPTLKDTEIAGGVVAAFAAQSRDDHLAVGLVDGRVLLYTFPDIKKSRTEIVGPSAANVPVALAFQGGKEMLGVAYKSGGVQVWDYQKKLEMPWAKEIDQTRPIECLAFAPKGLIVGYSDGAVVLYQPEGKTVKPITLLERGSVTKILGLTLSPDNNRLLVRQADKASVLDINTKQPQPLTGTAPLLPSSAAWIQNALAVGNTNGNVEFFFGDMKAPKNWQMPPKDDVAVAAMAFSPEWFCAVYGKKAHLLSLLEIFIKKPQ